jgi:hypothetical protein
MKSPGHAPLVPFLAAPVLYPSSDIRTIRAIVKSESKTVAILALLLVSCGRLEAQDPPGVRGPSPGGTVVPAGAFAAGDLDPVSWIGLELQSAYDTFGPPREVFPFRGKEEWQDNVVFFYPDFIYLFWYKNRVWQVRCDSRYRGSILGLTLGMERDEVKRVLSRTLREQGESIYFDIDTLKYPVRVRLVFSDQTLSDLYIYRSDF